MADKCDLILRDLPDDLFEKSELDRLTDELNSSVRSGKGAEKLEEIKERVKENKFKELTKSQIEKYNTLIKAANFDDFSTPFSDKVRALQSYLVGVYAKAKNAGASVDADMKARSADYQGRLQADLRSKKLFSFFMDKNNISDIAKAMFKEEDAPNNESKEVARSIKKIYKEQLDMLRSRGADIEELEDFIASQVHNRDEMLKTSKDWSQRIKDIREAFRKHGIRNTKAVQKELLDKSFNRWKTFIRPLIDDDRTFGPDKSEKDKEKILKNIYENIVKGKSYDEDAVYSGRGLKGKKIGEKRVIHFKDSDSYVKYNKEYGHGDIRQSIVNTLDNNSKNISILEKMGTNPDAWLRVVKNKIIKDSTDPNVKQKLEQINKYYDTVLGRDKSPVNHLWANISSSLRNIVSMGRLGGVVLKSLPDLVQELSALRSNGVGLLDRYKTVLGQMSVLMDKEKQHFLMDSLRVMNVMGHFNNRFMSLDSPGGAMTKAMSIYFKFNLQEYWDKSMRLGFAQAISRHLANLRNKNFDSLPEDLKRTFNRYGLDEKDWDLIRSNTEAMKNYGGAYYVTPDMASDFTKESLLEHSGKDKLTPSEMKDIQDQLQFKLQMYFLEETDTAQLTPSAADRAMLLRGHRPGTVAGEILRFVTQFKQYSLNITRRGLGRLLLQDSNDRLMQSILQGNVSGRGLLEYMVNAAILGYVSTAATNMIRSGYIPNPEKPSTWGQALIDGGGLGMFGDYIFHNYNKFGQGLADTLGGPVLGAASDLAKLMSTMADFDSDHHRLSYHQRVLKNVLLLTKSYAPFANMFYSKALFHYLLNHHVMNYVDPSYLPQHQANIRKQNQGNMNIL